MPEETLTGEVVEDHELPDAGAPEATPLEAAPVAPPTPEAQAARIAELEQKHESRARQANAHLAQLKAEKAARQDLENRLRAIETEKYQREFAQLQQQRQAILEDPDTPPAIHARMVLDEVAGLRQELDARSQADQQAEQQAALTEQAAQEAAYVSQVAQQVLTTDAIGAAAFAHLAEVERRGVLRQARIDGEDLSEQEIVDRIASKAFQTFHGWLNAGLNVSQELQMAAMDLGWNLPQQQAAPAARPTNGSSASRMQVQQNQQRRLQSLTRPASVQMAGAAGVNLGDLSEDEYVMARLEGRITEEQREEYERGFVIGAA